MIKEKIVLTDVQIQWLKKHFKHTKNDVIRERLGLSHSTLHRIARELGLKKTRQFMAKMQMAASMAGKAAIEAAGISNSQQYKLAGNSIVVAVLADIFRKMFVNRESETQQRELF